MYSSTTLLWIGHFPVEGFSFFFLLTPCFIEIPVLYANSVDPDQTKGFDLGPRCLLISLLLDARHKRVNQFILLPVDVSGITV